MLLYQITDPLSQCYKYRSIWYFAISKNDYFFYLFQASQQKLEVEAEVKTEAATPEVKPVAPTTPETPPPSPVAEETKAQDTASSTGSEVRAKTIY